MRNVIHWTFDDPGDYERSLRPATVSDLVVSEPGIFEASLTIVNVGRVWLQRGSETLARTAHIAMADAPRAVVFLADRETGPIIQSGAEFGVGDISSFGHNSGHFQRTFGPIRWAAMLLLPGDLQEVGKAISGRDIGDPSISRCTKPLAVHLTSLRKLHHEVIQMASSGDIILDHPEVRRSLEQTLVVSMVACLTSGVDNGNSSGWHRHQRIMQRLKEWLDTNSDRAVYLQEVCTTLNVSASTLRRCCEEHLGMSPMQYLWLRRMNLARHELQRQRSQTSVTEIALNFGFWHLGRFADEYRSMFGEPPSATLTRKTPR